MKIVAVTDRRQSARPFIDQIGLIASSGVDLVVLREKDLPETEYLQLAEKIKDICDSERCGFCINTFTDVALGLNTEYLWLPFGKFVTEGRPSISKVIVSVHSFEEAVKAEEKGSDILVYGNVFETTCKPGKEAKGFEELRKICDSCRIPVYAIGGITLDNMAPLRETGVSGICLMSGFMNCKDPAALVRAARDDVFRSP